MSRAILDQDLPRGLPLPLAQLHRRASNAKTPLERHHAAYYLWEAALKLLASVAIVEYTGSESQSRSPELSDKFKNLARPSLGHWWEFVRRLVPVLADSGDERIRAVRDLLLGGTRDDLPRAAGLDGILRETLGGGPGAQSTVRLTELFDRLVRYRNREIGHGAAGQRSLEFYDRMGRATLAGVGEVLAKLDVLAGRKLLYVEDVRRQASGSWLIEHYELLGEVARRLESLEIASAEGAALLFPRRLYLSYSPPRSLHPLVLFSEDTGETLFLNARRGRKKCEYLSYSSGRVVDRDDLELDQHEALGRILGIPVNAETAEGWALRSQAEEPAEAVPAAEAAGRRVGDFDLLSKIGRGGMGIVYRAWQPSLGRQVALKCLLRSGDPKAEARFAREIRSLGRVEHPHLVKIFTSGSEGDQWFYAMELLEGADLAGISERLGVSSAGEVSEAEWKRAISTACEEARKKEEPLASKSEEPAPARAAVPSPLAPPEGTLEGAEPLKGTGSGPPRKDRVRTGEGHLLHAVEVIRQVSGAAHALHEAGVIHRDIKPGNILLTADGSHAVLMDLGLAQLADDAEGRLTRTRQFVGTLRYASPEQVLSVGNLDRRSDVYSLGVTLWELLTLKPIFAASEETPTPELMLRIQSADPERPSRLNPRVPIDLEAIVLKCLEKDPTRRYRTAAELAEDLRRFQDGTPVTAQPPTFRYLMGKFMRRYRKRLAAAAALFLVAVAATAFALYSTNSGRLEARRKLGRQLLDRGVRLMEEGQYPDALLLLAEALRLGTETPGEEETCRMRIAAVLRRCPKLTRIWYHHGPVSCAAFSRDGNRVVTASADGTARIWSCDTGEALAPPLVHAGRVVSAAFSPDGSRVVTASDDHTARIWSAVTGEPATPPLRHREGLTSAQFSPDGTRVLTASRDNTAQLWSASTGEALGPRLEHKNSVEHAVFSPDGFRILTTAGFSGARFWDAATARPLGPPVRDETVINGSFSPDGRRAVTTSFANVAKVWEVPSGGLLIETGAHQNGIRDAEFSPDGRRLVTAGIDGTARVWNASTGQAVTPFLKHGDFVNLAGFSPDGNLVLTASEDGSARLWDAAKGDLLAVLKHQGGVTGASFSPDGRRVLTASRDGTARQWDLAAQDGVNTIRHLGDVDQASFSPDGGLVATASKDFSGRVWEASTGEPAGKPLKHSDWVSAARFSPDGRQVLTASWDHTARVWTLAGEPITTPIPQPAGVIDACFSPEGRRILTGCRDGTARIWDAATGVPLTPPLKHPHDVNLVSFSPDGGRVLVATNWMGGEVQVWSASTGEPLLTLRQSGCAAFSPNGRRIAAAGSTVEARVWDAQSGAPLTPPMSHNDLVRWIAFSPDGRRLLTGDDDQTARIWDAVSGKQILPSLRHGARVWHVSFSPEGARVVTSSEDCTSRVWDAATSQPVAPPLMHGSHVWYASFSPDGRRLVTASLDGTAAVLDLSPDAKPVADLVLFGELLSGQRIDPEGALRCAEPSSLLSVWKSLRSRYPAAFAASREDVASWHRREAEDCRRAENWPGVLQHLESVPEMSRASLSDLLVRAEAYAAMGRFLEAAAVSTMAIERGGDVDGLLYRIALLKLRAGDREGYRTACGSLADRLRKTKDHSSGVWAVSAAVLSGAAPPSPDLLEEAASLAGDDPSYPNRRNLGAALYRAGRLEEAARELSVATTMNDGRLGAGPWQPQAWALLCAVNQRLGRNDAARECLEKSLESKGSDPWVFSDTSHQASLEARLSLEIFLAEARSLIGPDGGR